MNESPIFIHSLFRAGSTYLFNVFRRSAAGYWCYQESLHEVAVFARNEPKLLLEDHGEEQAIQLRHPRIDKPYFQELYDTWPAWKDALSESAVYNGYFAPPNAEIGIPYWRILADAAKDRVVFQECRTSSRIAAIKEQLGGYHIYLWRNPWDQWWSYKVSQYFDVANQLIINAPNPPAALVALCSNLGFETYVNTDISGAFAHFWSKPLSAEESYLIFYMLWCLGLQQGRNHADLMLNIDRLSDLPAYQDELQQQLEEAGIIGLNFSDCHVPQGLYLDQDRTFFTNLEDRVHAWLRIGGWSQADLDQIQALREQLQPASWHKSIETLSPLDLTEQVTRARALARGFETNISEISRKKAAEVADANLRVQQSETLAQQAEVRVQQEVERAMQAESRAQQSETHAQQSESRVQQAEVRVQQEVERAMQAESRAQQSESRVQQAEIRVQQEVERVAQAESRAQQSEARAQQAEVRIQQEIERAMQAESRAQQSEARAQQAEIRIQQEIERVAQAEKRAQQFEENAMELMRRVATAEAAANQAWQQVNGWHERVLALHNSTSWKLTKPLRAVMRLARGDFSPVRRLTSHFHRQLTWIGNIFGVPKAYAIAREPIEHGVRYIARRPRLKKFGMLFLTPFPALEAKLKERRSAQVRSDFILQFTKANVKTGSGINYQRLESTDVLSLISTDRSPLTIDEILVRIREELTKIHVEK